jgi:hypothetical protein
MRVLSSKMVRWLNLPVAGDGVHGSVVSLERDVESNDTVASLDKSQVVFRDASLLCGSFIEHLDLLQESRLLVLVQLGSEFLGSFRGEHLRL